MPDRESASLRRKECRLRTTVCAGWVRGEEWSRLPRGRGWRGRRVRRALPGKQYGRSFRPAPSPPRPAEDRRVRRSRPRCPPAKSIKALPSTSVTSAPRASLTKTGMAFAQPRGTARLLRFIKALLLGPGISVLILVEPSRYPSSLPTISTAPKPVVYGWSGSDRMSRRWRRRLASCCFRGERSGKE